MKMKKMASIGLIFGILLLTGLLVMPVSASDDTSWITPAPIEDIMAWFSSTTQNIWTGSAGGSGTGPVITPSYIRSNDSSRLTPSLPDPAITWGLMISKPTAVTAFPSTISHADRISLFKTYHINGYGPVLPVATVTSIPTTLPVYPSGDPVIHNRPITMPTRSYHRSSTMPTAFPTQGPSTIPATPYYRPSRIPTAFPTQAPTSEVTLPGQNTGISLTELNLAGKYVRITNTGTTPVVMTGWKITNSQGASLTFIDFPLGDGTTFTYVLNDDSTLTVYFGRDGMISANELYYPDGVDFWNQNGDSASLYNPQGQLVGRITIPATPNNIPSTIPTAFPTQVPTSGSTTVPGQNSVISLTELNLPGKYVTITNTGTTPVVMTGWKITNSQGTTLTFIDFPLGGGTTYTYVLNDDSTLTVYFGRDGMISANELYYPDGVDFWNQNGDSASLYNPQGQLVGRTSA